MKFSTSHLSVLIIDDQRFQRSFLARLLRQVGVSKVHEACNGQNALDMLTQMPEPVDLIISDIDMPKMDGLEFLRWLGRLAPRTPILIHSALEHNLLRSVEAMAVEYGLSPVGILEDPVTPESLGLALERAQMQIPRERLKQEPTISVEEVVIAAARNEFEPWFQPKLELGTGKVMGVEALLRWHRPDNHVMLPAQFLAQMETAGIMKQCTLRVAARAAECINLILDKEADFSVAMNVSPSLLDDPGFAAELSDALISSGARPEHIIIEVTENAMTRNQGAMLENLARMRMRGFRISIDDFCTGYSSMAQLTRSAFSELKIDRQFVGKMFQGNREWLLIESTVALAHRLGLRTVAEGVEDEYQLQALKQFGCDAAQGFLIARPMPVLELMQWMERNRRHVANTFSATRTAHTQTFDSTLDRIVIETSTSALS